MRWFIWPDRSMSVFAVDIIIIINPKKEARKVVVIFDHEHFSQFPKQNSEDKQPRLGGGCGMDENRKRLTQDEGKQTK
jgi:hypothetical protein